MVDRGVEADIAFIRSALEEGRAYARRRSPDMAVWGLLVAGGYLATYAYVRHWSSVGPGYVWLAAVAIGWAFSLRRWWLWLLGDRSAVPVRSPMVRAYAMLWLGCGISLMTLGIAASWADVMSGGWYNTAAASIIAIAFFAGSFLSGVSWLRLVAIPWWAGAVIFYRMQDTPNVELFGAAMMLLFLAVPGLVLFLSAPASE